MNPHEGFMAQLEAFDVKLNGEREAAIADGQEKKVSLRLVGPGFTQRYVFGDCAMRYSESRGNSIFERIRCSYSLAIFCLAYRVIQRGLAHLGLTVRRIAEKIRRVYPVLLCVCSHEARFVTTTRGRQTAVGVLPCQTKEKHWDVGLYPVGRYGRTVPH